MTLTLKNIPVKSFILLVGSFVFWQTAAVAQTPKQNPAAAQALQKAQGMLRQLSQENVSLKADNTAFQERLKQLEAEVAKLAPLQAELESYKTNLAAAQNANVNLQTTMQTQLAKAAEKEQNLHRKLQETVAKAQLIKKDNQLLVSGLQEREQWISQCSEKNQKLVETNLELVKKYHDKSFWDKVADIEPFTGIGQVKTENTVQEYQFKLEDLKTVSFQSQADTEQDVDQNPEGIEESAVSTNN